MLSHGELLDLSIQLWIPPIIADEFIHELINLWDLFIVLFINHILNK